MYPWGNFEQACEILFCNDGCFSEISYAVFKYWVRSTILRRVRSSPITDKCGYLGVHSVNTTHPRTPVADRVSRGYTFWEGFNDPKGIAWPSSGPVTGTIPSGTTRAAPRPRFPGTTRLIPAHSANEAT